MPLIQQLRVLLLRRGRLLLLQKRLDPREHHSAHQTQRAVVVQLREVEVLAESVPTLDSSPRAYRNSCVSETVQFTDETPDLAWFCSSKEVIPEPAWWQTTQGEGGLPE